MRMPTIYCIDTKLYDSTTVLTVRLMDLKFDWPSYSLLASHGGVKSQNSVTCGFMVCRATVRNEDCHHQIAKIKI